MKNAYVTLVMLGDDYVSGAMVLAHSLRILQSKADLICMVTSDVSKKGVDALKSIFDKVVLVEYLKYESAQLKSKKQEEIYKKWKSVSFTKWRCLGLTEYAKICFLDADMIIIRNLDHLFDLRTPAGSFTNIWGQGSYPTGEISIKDHKTNYVVNGHLLVVEPSADKLKNYINMMKKSPFTFRGTISMVDEVSINYFMIDKIWTNIGFDYNYVLWHTQGISKITKSIPKPYLIHYPMLQKPWNLKRFEWDDIEIWWQYAQDLKVDTSVFDAKKLQIKPKLACPYCIEFNKIEKTPIPTNHLFIKDGKITCSRLI